MLVRWASSLTAVVKSTFSCCITNLNTSPPAPQPKQWKIWRCGLTWNDGVFSLWNGHSALNAEPARRSWR